MLGKKTPLLPSELKGQDHHGLCFISPEATPTLLPKAEEVNAPFLSFAVEQVDLRGLEIPFLPLGL